MTSETPIDAKKKADAKKDCTKFAEDKTTSEKAIEGDKKKKSHELMRLVYELPEDIKRPEVTENNNMLKENPPVMIVEITDQNGCELDKKCDNDYLTEIDSSPENLGNSVVYDVLATNELIMHAEEYKEVIVRSSPDDCTDEDLSKLKKLLESSPKVLERYLKECASSDEMNRLHSLTSTGPLSPRPNHQARSTSVTSDLFQLWLASSPVKVSDNDMCN